MRGQGAAARSQSSYVRWCWGAGIALLLLVLALSGPFDQATSEQISMSALVAAGLVAAVSCGWRAARSRGRRRRAWGALALGGVVGLAGNVYAGLVGDPETGDAAYIAALLLGVVGLSLFPTARPRGQELARMLLDSVVVGGSVLYIAIFAVALAPAGTATQPALTAYALPVVDALLATLAVLVMTRSSTTERVPLVLVGGGFVLYAVADVAFALLSATGDFAFGSPIDAGWVGGYVAIALAARHPAASGSRVAGPPGHGTPLLGTVVTFCLFLAAALVRVSQTSQTLPGGANALWVAVLVAVVARQIIVVADNESLRHGLERRVQERTSQLRSLASERERTLESVADGIYGVDLEGRVTFINAAAAHTLGASAADLVGREAHATFHASAEDGAAQLPEHCHITQAVRDGITATAKQDVYRRLDGKDVPVEVTTSPLRDDGGIRGAVVAFRDVTERREMERIKDEFVSVVSHELRTPLTAIRGALGLLDSGALDGSPEQAARMARIALTSSERLSRLVDDILDMERLDAGTTRLELAEHRVNRLVAVAVDQVSVLAEAAGVVVIPTGSQEIVHADGERIVQTLTNLLSNAVKYSPRGGVVRVTAVLVGDLVELRVDDEGRGIPPEKLEAVFGRFEQVDASDTRERGGSGLGLAIARSIVERHGGRLWAVSEGEGRGSSFRFTLRRVAPRPARGAVRRPDGTFATTKVVVVVDDDSKVIDVLRTVLEGRGYDVVAVTNVHAALEAIGTEDPSAVVLDLAIPGASGAEALTRLIRQRPHQNRVLIVEDDGDLRRVVATVLENGGLTVTQASSVAEARDAIARGDEPDLVVLDLVLPGGSGHELVADLRRDGQLRRIPLVVYSAAEVNAAERERLRLGETIFLTKGLTAPDVVLWFVLDLLDAPVEQPDDVDRSRDLPSSRT